MGEDIRGFWVAAATPLTEGGNVDHARLADHAEWLFSEGADGLVLFGTTGEGTSFSSRERLATVSALLERGVGPERIALGAGFPAITDSIALCRDALTLGLRHVLILPPYFYRDVDATGIEEGFAAIIEGVGDARLRATLYHIPQVSGVAVPPVVLANLRRRFGATLAGIKDSSTDFNQFRAFRAAAPEVSVTIGNEADIGLALAEGGAGTICGMANLVPRLVRAMFTDADAAAAMQAAIDLIDGPFVSTLKAGLAELTRHPGWSRVRAPLCPTSSAAGVRLADGLARIKLSEAA